MQHEDFFQKEKLLLQERQELACSTLINRCISHCMKQPHADEVLDCILVEVNHKRFLSYVFQPPTEK